MSEVESEEIRARIKDFISQHVAPIDPDELGDDTDLTEGIVDSFGFVVLLHFIEEEIGRPLLPEERTRETAGTVRAVGDFMVREARQ